MKKRILSLAVVMCCLIPGVNAQQKGEFWVGGSVGLDYSKVKDGKDRMDLNILPELGYGISDRWGIGLNFGYVHNENLIGTTKIKSDGFKVMPFARFTINPDSKCAFFLDGGAGYTYLDNGNSTKTHVFDVGVRPGVSFRVSNGCSVTGKFGFLGYEYEKTGGRKVNSFAADFDLEDIQIGLIFMF